MDLKKQPEPSDSTCPYCGGEPEYDPEHVLAATGYTHDDVKFTCSDCSERWTSGVPIGEQDGEFSRDLFCRSCKKRYGLVHRVEPAGEHGVWFHMKCPNSDCYNYWKFKRLSDDDVILTGYPQITGDTSETTNEYGHGETVRHTQRNVR